MSSEYSGEPDQLPTVEVQEQPERPLGITILAVLSGVGGILAILGGLAMGALAGASGAMGMPALGPFAAFGSAFAILMGIINLAIAYGLWNGRSWAWWLTIIFSALNALSSLVSMMLLSLVIAVVVIWYMLRPHVKAFFGVS